MTQRITAEMTFSSRAEAEVWLARKEFRGWLGCIITPRADGDKWRAVASISRGLIPCGRDPEVDQ